LIFFSGNQKTEDLLYQAMSYMEKRQPKAAIPLFKKTLKIKPDFIEAYISLGNAFKYLKKFEESIFNFRKF